MKVGDLVRYLRYDDLHNFRKPDKYKHLNEPAYWRIISIKDKRLILASVYNIVSDQAKRYPVPMELCEVVVPCAIGDLVNCKFPPGTYLLTRAQEDFIRNNLGKIVSVRNLGFIVKAHYANGLTLEMRDGTFKKVFKMKGYNWH